MAEPSDFQLEIRPANPEDAPYLLSSWLATVRKDSPFAHGVAPELVKDGHRPILVRLLQRSDVLVAHPAGDPETVLGYIVHDKCNGQAVVHHIYVRNSWRQQGIATALLRAAGLNLRKDKVLFSFRTFDASTFARRYSNLAYNPYLHFGESWPSPSHKPSQN